MRRELRIAGFGGQGVVLSGVVLGDAASEFGGLFASQTQSYGPEARGGACKAEVVISDEPIDYPNALDLEILVALNQESLDKYLGEVKAGGTLIVDADLVRNVPDDGEYVVHRIPATKKAEDVLGRRIVANMVMLGAVTALTGIVELGDLEGAIRQMVPAGTEELNVKAARLGYELGSE